MCWICHGISIEKIHSKYICKGRFYIRWWYKFIYLEFEVHYLGPATRLFNYCCVALYINMKLQILSSFLFFKCSCDIFTIYNGNRSWFSIYFICIYIYRCIFTESLCFLLRKIILYFPEKNTFAQFIFLMCSKPWIITLILLYFFKAYCFT